MHAQTIGRPLGGENPDRASDLHDMPSENGGPNLIREINPAPAAILIHLRPNGRPRAASRIFPLPTRQMPA
jgi:hypothetical protein